LIYIIPKLLYILIVVTGNKNKKDIDLRISKQGQSFITELNNKMDSRGSSIIGRVSSSDDSTCNQDEFNNSNQSYQNHFLDDLRKNQGIENPIRDTNDQVNPEMVVTNVFFR